jgi:hypothetical protein
MFTLSDKQRVLNQPASVKAFTPAGAEVTVAANIVATDKLSIDGFGHFDIAAITDIQCRRARPAVAESATFAISVPAGLAVGDAIEVKVEMDTARYDSTLFVQDRLGGTKPMVFTTAPLAAVTAAAIATAVNAAYTAYVNTFPKGTFQITVGGAGTNITTLANAGYEHLTVRKLSIKRLSDSQFLFSPIALPKVVVAAGFQGEGLGKFLEESIRMNTPITSNVYGVDNTETQVDLRGSYTAVYFTVQANYNENLSTIAADHAPLNATHDFVVFLNEATCNGANSAISKLASIALLKAGTNGMTAAVVTAANLTLALEKSEVMLVAAGGSVATVAAFIA